MNSPPIASVGLLHLKAEYVVPITGVRCSGWNMRKKIIQEACEKFPIEHAVCIHRTGTLELRELAVWIAVFAKHREASYRANEYIIDQVKTRVPIWKKEFYADGQTDWVKCLSCAAKGIPHHEHFHHRA